MAEDTFDTFSIHSVKEHILKIDTEIIELERALMVCEKKLFKSFHDDALDELNIKWDCVYVKKQHKVLIEQISFCKEQRVFWENTLQRLQNEDVQVDETEKPCNNCEETCNEHKYAHVTWESAR